MERFWLAFLPLFVAFDVVGVLPIYWGLAQGQHPSERRQAVHNAIVVAFAVAVVFLFVSRSIFDLMGIQMADLLIAGGVILLGLSLNDLLHPEKIPYASTEGMGVVPLGVPLIVGPAVLTTLSLVRQRYGLNPTLVALCLNTFLTWVVLLTADRLLRWLGREGAKVVSKVANLVLAAFAVMLIRQGVTTIFPAP